MIGNPLEIARKPSESFDIDRDNTTISSDQYSDFKIGLDEEESAD